MFDGFGDVVGANAAGQKDRLVNGFYNGFAQVPAMCPSSAAQFFHRGIGVAAAEQDVVNMTRGALRVLNGGFIGYMDDLCQLDMRQFGANEGVFT